MTTPKWADEMVAQVCEGASAGTPEVVWRRSRGSVLSSGHYQVERKLIVVTAGSLRKDQRLVLLHELAHHLANVRGHGAEFWRTAWLLFQSHGLAKYALVREADYRATATTVAVQLGIRGAVKASIAARAGRERKRENRQRNVCPMPAHAAEAQGYGTPHTHYVGTIHRWHDDDGYHDEWTPPR